MDLVEAGARGSQPDVRHPWERARFSTAARLIARHVRLMPGDAVLDVGCGDTFVVEQLARAYPDVQCHAVDSAFTGTLLETYRARLTVPNVSLFASLDDVPLRRPASLVLLMDVLEHVADDAELLQDLMRRPLFDSQTCMFITVPAYAWLFSSHDRLLGHYRRYSTRTLQSLLDRMNLSPVETGGLFASLLPLRALQMITERLAPTSADAATDLTTWNGSETTTRLLTAALSADVRLTRALARIGIRVPGLSNFVVCRKSA